ncbi:transporter substrate-binding domain-containing protein [Ornithinimicrobium sufpigmenti]|uniref:transporter substrate-binding domain-containing protein n=1 Tax=Ornithinimicrobium sufpigmenti TaxID=2508882 RepID=UPI00103644CF|nr:MULTISPECIES: transporter substrate-binding domain-containing protein [unclassified Ornithinimicrobium]
MTRLWPTVLAGALLLTGCGVDIPVDPDGTLDAIVASGELTVGVSPNPPFTTLPESPDGPPGGTEVARVTGFAESLGVEPVWVVGGEEELVRQLEEGEIQVLIGGLTDKNPHLTKAGTTRPYVTTPEHGEQVKHVMAVVPGENALLSALERFLDGESPR